MRILALDPGGTTGFVIWENGRIVDTGQLEDDHHEALWELLESWHVVGDTIVCERFDHRNNEFSKLTSVEYIGIVKLFQQTHRANVAWQGSDVKDFATNEKLKAVGWLKTPKTYWRHCNDAQRHLLYYIICGKGYIEAHAYREDLLKKIRDASVS